MSSPLASNDDCHATGPPNRIQYNTRWGGHLRYKSIVFMQRWWAGGCDGCDAGHIMEFTYNHSTLRQRFVFVGRLLFAGREREGETNICEIIDCHFITGWYYYAPQCCHGAAAPLGGLCGYGEGSNIGTSSGRWVGRCHLWQEHSTRDVSMDPHWAFLRYVNGGLLLSVLRQGLHRQRASLVTEKA